MRFLTQIIDVGPGWSDFPGNLIPISAANSGPSLRLSIGLLGRSPIWRGNVDLLEGVVSLHVVGMGTYR